MSRYTPLRAARLFIALLLLVLSMTLLTPARTEALPECGTHYNYFDSTHTFHVGYKKFDCYGNLVSSWGTVTGWYDVYEYLWCCDAA